MPKISLNYFLKKLDNSRLIRYLLLIGLGWVIVEILTYFEKVIIIFIFAAILAFLLSFPVQWLRRFLRHDIAVILVFVVSVLLLGGLAIAVGLAVLSQGQDLLGKAPEFFTSLLAFIERLEELFNRWDISVNFSAIEEQIRNRALSAFGVGLATLEKVLSNLVDLIAVVVVGFFMLLDGGRLWRFAIQLFPDRLQDDITEAIRRNFLGFFWGRLILSVFFGVSAFAVFWLLRVPYALLLGAIAGVFDLIPGIGAALGISLIALSLLPQGILLSLKVLAVCIVLQQIEENLLMPRVMQGSININPVLMFFALFVGARVAGLVGLFLSIPIAGTIVNLLEIEELKGER